MLHFYRLASSVALITVLGCSSFQTAKQTIDIIEPEPGIEPEATETAFMPLPEMQSDLAYRYVAETDVLDQVELLLEEATAARIDGFFGLAESKIEEALILSHDVDLALIHDTGLLERFNSTLAALAQENGRLLFDISIIAEEDPMAWLEDVDIEQFRAGEWSDEELEEIVNKIALKCDVPIEFNQRVRNAIYYFQNGRRNEMVAWQQRSGRYLDMMRDIFFEEGLPLDLVYLSMIESGFKPSAYSKASAVGLWQFIYSTGKIYGLDRNTYIDERRDPLKSTLAAARHLNDLYKETDDWNNVMAAYNCGPRRITRQLAQNPNLEYWDMQLPRETQNYVPFFMAAVVISKAPEVFGFDNIEKDSPFEYDLVEVHPYTSLSVAAQCAGVDVATIKELNPELLRNQVPPGGDSYELRIPKDTSEQFAVAYAEIPVETYQPPQVEYVNVQRGDTFSGIADRNRVSISALRSANPQIANINRLSIGQRIYMPGTARTTSTRQPVVVDRENTQSYVVQRNDTLGIIARRHGTTYPVIQALNNMGSSTRIYPGDRLLVPGATSSTTAANIIASSAASGTYTVQRNDNLDDIARRFGTTYQVLQALNNMGSSTRIYPGDSLVVPGPASASGGSTTTVASTGTGDVVYVIQKNDTVYEIAQRYGVDYRKVLEHNQIRNHRLIKPGDRIVIPR